MSNFSYVAFDTRGRETTGSLDVADQSEAIRRIREMGFFPFKVVMRSVVKPVPRVQKKAVSRNGILRVRIPLAGGRVKKSELSVFTRQTATLLEAGLPLLRGLRLLEEQETNPQLKQVLGEIGATIESGDSLSEALAHHPKIFDRLYINMVKAGEIGGVVDLVLKRLADFMEKAEKIKGKVVAALFYPAAVISVAVIIMGILLVFVVPKFKEVFAGLLPGTSMPTFTTFVLDISEAVKNHILLTMLSLFAAAVVFKAAISTRFGRRLFDRFKLKMPVIGPIIRKVAISRFSRTFGTLVSSGVPMLQTLSIIEETTGNVIVGEAVADVHESVKNGQSIAAPLKASGIFPSMVVGMIDVGEQTGALPEMLMKVADTYDEQVDTAVAGLTSLLEPIMIVLLAILVGSIVIALFLPLIIIIERMGETDRVDA